MRTHSARWWFGLTASLTVAAHRAVDGRHLLGGEAALDDFAVERFEFFEHGIAIGVVVFDAEHRAALAQCRFEVALQRIVGRVMHLRADRDARRRARGRDEHAPREERTDCEAERASEPRTDAEPRSARIANVMGPVVVGTDHHRVVDVDLVDGLQLEEVFQCLPGLPFQVERDDNPRAHRHNLDRTSPRRRVRVSVQEIQDVGGVGDEVDYRERRGRFVRFRPSTIAIAASRTCGGTATYLPLGGAAAGGASVNADAWSTSGSGSWTSSSIRPTSSPAGWMASSAR